MRLGTAFTLGVVGTVAVQSISRTFWRVVVALVLMLVGLAVLVVLVAMAGISDEPATPGHMARAVLYSLVAVFICLVSVTKMADREPFTVFRYGAIILEARGRRLKRWSILLALSWLPFLAFTLFQLTVPATVTLVILTTAMIGFGITVGLRPRYYAAH